MNPYDASATCGDTETPKGAIVTGAVPDDDETAMGFGIIGDTETPNGAIVTGAVACDDGVGVTAEEYTETPKGAIVTFGIYLVEVLDEDDSFIGSTVVFGTGVALEGSIPSNRCLWLDLDSEISWLSKDFIWEGIY